MTIRWLTALLFVLGLMAPVAAAPRFKVAPEVMWITIHQSGRKIGFARGEYKQVGPDQYSFDYLMVLHLQKTKNAEQSSWSFDGRLRPVAFKQKFIGWQKGMPPVINTAEGTFDWMKGVVDCSYREFEKDEKFQVPLPQSCVSRFATNIALAYAKLKPGRVFECVTFSPNARQFFKTTIKVVGQSGRRFKLEQSSEEKPGAVGTVWFEGSSPQHPNGFAHESTFPGANGQFELKASTRDIAITGFEDEAKEMGL